VRPQTKYNAKDVGATISRPLFGGITINNIIKRREKL